MQDSKVAASTVKTDASAFKSRAVTQKLLSREQGEGRGARVRRSIGRQELRHFDPFLMVCGAACVLISLQDPST